MSDTNKNAILLINLGSPRELSKESVKKYLKIFLSDDYVVDIPKFFQQLILKIFILPFRPKITLHAYEQIWTEKRSPLIISTLKLGEKLAKKLVRKFLSLCGMKILVFMTP
jgi:ferrochelatase